jgi:hypothetical protein
MPEGVKVGSDEPQLNSGEEKRRLHELELCMAMADLWQRVGVAGGRGRDGGPLLEVREGRKCWRGLAVVNCHLQFCVIIDHKRIVACFLKLDFRNPRQLLYTKNDNHIGIQYIAD